MEKAVIVDKIPQLNTKSDLIEIIQFTNKLMRDNVQLKFRMVKLTEWMVQIEKKLIQGELPDKETQPW